ncbi:hypothetical protein FQA39_LY06148 [Lamprigera yunnana]|nr:hypothetical protein FQA39_LY06148 [Lamprigera yunnana]
MYVILVRERKGFSIFNFYQTQKKRNNMHSNSSCTQKSQQYGSLFLRSGAVAFGIGSMVYSGLKFGHYFKLKNNQECISSVLQAVVSVTRIILTLVQIQFIFFNSKDIELNKHKVVVRFGLMHMIATNLYEWLYVLIEETIHEIAHLAEHSNGSSFVHYKYCLNDYVMDSVVKNASKYLFPCSIQFSLICAVILYETWKKLNRYAGKDHTLSRKKIWAHFDFETNIHHNLKSTYHISMDCSNMRRGLFAGIVVIVLTIISLIMISVLNNDAVTTDVTRRLNGKNTEFEVNVMELVLYVITAFTVLYAMYRMRELKYDRKSRDVSLNKTLLLVAQTGMFTYCIFSIIGCCFTLSYNSPAGLLTEVFSFIQASLQTLFVLDGWWRRFRNLEQPKRKPGRELVTFLIIANMAMWTINTVEKNRTEFRSSHLQFFGDWTWTIIIHISMPLVIFYRFHSTVCLYEIWKSAYKIKRKHSLSPYFST